MPSLLKVLVLLGIAGTAFGQSHATASKTSGLGIFAGGSYVKPGLGRPAQGGFLFGLDYTSYLFPHFYLVPSLEARGTISPKTGSASDDVGENTFGGGIRVDHTYSRYTPYADFLISAGTIKYGAPAPNGHGGLTNSNNSFVLSYGGGVDIRIVHYLAAKVDVQGSRWNTNPDVSPTFHPAQIGFGVVYTPFSSH